jgi:hypothetical protein
MVVHEHERAGGLAKRGAQDVTRVDGAAVQTSFGDAPGRAQAIAAVERKHPELLVVEASEPHAGPACDLGGGREVEAGSTARPHEHAATELESGRDARRFRQPNPLGLRESVRAGTRKPHQAAPLFEQIRCHPLHGPPFFARSEKHRQKFEIGEGVEALGEPALTREERERHRARRDIGRHASPRSTFWTKGQLRRSTPRGEDSPAAELARSRRAAKGTTRRAGAVVPV